ncbi:MAG: diguanylate cyclase [Candidatus Riflebacteria bacterium]|nr:diguanylate cyclase [Candidatus Riflebacteria bacterium]
MKLIIKDIDGNLVFEGPLKDSGNGVKIGRSSSCEIKIASASLADEHLAIRLTDKNKLLIQDLQSSFGIKIDGERLPPGFIRELPLKKPIQLSDNLILIVEASPQTVSDTKVLQNTEFSKKGQLFPFFVEKNERFVKNAFSHLKNKLPKEWYISVQYVEDQIRDKIKELSAILDVGFALSSVTSYGRLLEHVVDMAMEVSGADFGRILLHNEEMDRLETMIMRVSSGKNAARESRESEACVLECFRGSDIITRVIPVFSSPASIPANQAKSISTPRPLAIAPLRVQNTTIGVLHLEKQNSAEPFPDSATEPLRTFAAQAALAIGHAKLFHMSTIDGLTGLSNNRHFHQRFLEEFSRGIRHKIPMSILLIDIDNFAQVNQQNSDSTGDMVLKKFGRTIKSAMRVHDLAARISGEEFAVILPSTPVTGAKTVADKLAGLVAKTLFRIGKKSIRINISIGIAVTTAETLKTTDLYQAAQDSLLEAKKAGGNRIVIARQK